MDQKNAVQNKAPKTVQKQSSEIQSSAHEAVEDGSPFLQMCGSIGNRGTAQLMSETGSFKSSTSFSSLIQKFEDQESDSELEPELELEPEVEQDEIMQQKGNDTGMPDGLKSGIENLSGMDMSDVKVNYNSNKPEEVGALAYTQGSDIHIAPGQEKHLAHEAWHVAQQKGGRVQPTTQVNGKAVNDDPSLEKEADDMGAKALSFATQMQQNPDVENQNPTSQLRGKDILQQMPIQMKTKMEEALEAKIGAHNEDKDAIFDAYIEVLKSKNFTYSPSETNDLLETLGGPGNCGSLATGLKTLFQTFAGQDVNRERVQNISLDIPSTFVDQNAPGNCKDASGKELKAYFFSDHSYLTGYDPTSGIKNPVYKSATYLKKEDILNLLGSDKGKYATEKGLKDIMKIWEFDDHIILVDFDSSARAYTKVSKTNIAASLKKLNIIKKTSWF